MVSYLPPSSAVKPWEGIVNKKPFNVVKRTRHKYIYNEIGRTF